MRLQDHCSSAGIKVTRWKHSYRPNSRLCTFTSFLQHKTLRRRFAAERMLPWWCKKWISFVRLKNPELTLKLLCHLQILLHRPGPSFSSRKGVGWGGVGIGSMRAVVIDTLHTQREILCCTLLFRVNSEFVFFGGLALHQLSSVSMSSVLLLLSIRGGRKQFVCEAFWISKTSGDCLTSQD